MELCCNSLLHQQCVGQAGSGASGQEKAPGGVTGLASCLLPLPAPCSGEVRVLCCSLQIHAVSLGLSPSPLICASSMSGCSHLPRHAGMQPWRGGECHAHVRCSPRCFLCSAPVFCPTALLRGGGQAAWTPPVALPLSPIPHPKKGKSL